MMYILYQIKGEYQMGKQENEISNSIKDFINSSMGLVWRNNAGTLKVSNRYIHLAPKGSPDLIGVMEGYAIGVETKIPGKDASEAQIKFKREFEINGGVYILAHSLDEFLKEWYAFKDGQNITPEDISAEL